VIRKQEQEEEEEMRGFKKREGGRRKILWWGPQPLLPQLSLLLSLFFLSFFSFASFFSLSLSLLFYFVAKATHKQLTTHTSEFWIFSLFLSTLSLLFFSFIHSNNSL